ncbi:hypothetical protein [Vibrio hepatarius]|uniref:hypothetical protein n=1 Tax=Vibrio hepatarius TaxID=171383 RepID=UPI001C084B7C|nr:hypothetical protein [Vibrio hepatarius]MBU2899070.1 hypothetical protein [Vibrio hepatarius]
MTDIVTKYAALIAGFSVIPFFITNAYLTIKLKPLKYDLMRSIADSAPEKFKSRALFLMEGHMSWLAGSACSYIWFVYPMLRIAWQIPSDDIVKWQKDICEILGTNYRLYWLSTMLLNLTLAGIAVFVINEYLLRNFI